MKFVYALALIASVALCGCNLQKGEIARRDIPLDAFGLEGFALRVIDPLPDTGVLHRTYPITVYLFFRGGKRTFVSLKQFSFSMESSASYGSKLLESPDFDPAHELYLHSGGMLAITTAFRFAESVDPMEDIKRITLAYGINNPRGISWYPARLAKNGKGEIRVKYFVHIATPQHTPVKIPVFSVLFRVSDNKLINITETARPEQDAAGGT